MTERSLSCPKCGGSLSPTCGVCPKCGKKVRRPRPPRRTVLIGLLVLLAILCALGLVFLGLYFVVSLFFQGMMQFR